MKVAFRTDASLRIGTGHVMRCLTLADALTARGAECHFICRVHRGHLIDLIRCKGHIVHELSAFSMVDTEVATPGQQVSETAPVDWLGATQAQDAEACVPIVVALQPEWLIVDHYALDVEWERALRQHCGRLMVIDDLADRAHACDVLLDQTYGRKEADYGPFVPASCRLLCGTQYALLRPEFAALRPHSLQRRAQPVLRELLVTMGGVDMDNVTGGVLEALCACPLPADCRITVVMGVTAPWCEQVKAQAQTMPWSTRVLVGVNDMAQLMADSDLAIGAAGTTSWERCCMGLPTIMIVLTDNQCKIAEELQRLGAAQLLSSGQRSVTRIRELLLPYIDNSERLGSMSRRAASIVDGSGLSAVILQLEA